MRHRLSVVSSGHWYVLIEEYIPYPRLSYVAAEGYEHALALAYDRAMNHVPHYPMRPRSRDLFRVQDGSWLVHVQGAVTQRNFRVSVAQFHGTFPGVPQANPA